MATEGIHSFVPEIYKRPERDNPVSQKMSSMGLNEQQMLLRDALDETTFLSASMDDWRLTHTPVPSPQWRCEPCLNWQSVTALQSLSAPCRRAVHLPVGGTIISAIVLSPSENMRQAKTTSNSLYRLAIGLVLVNVLIVARLAFDVGSTTYQTAISAIYQSGTVQKFVGGEIKGAMLIGLRNESHTTTFRGVRTSLACASRLFIVRGERVGIVGLQVRELLLGWSAPGPVKCSTIANEASAQAAGETSDPPH